VTGTGVVKGKYYVKGAEVTAQSYYDRPEYHKYIAGTTASAKDIKAYQEHVPTSKQVTDRQMVVGSKTVTVPLSATFSDVQRAMRTKTPLASEVTRRTVSPGVDEVTITKSIQFGDSSRVPTSSSRKPLTTHKIGTSPYYEVPESWGLAPDTPKEFLKKGAPGFPLEMVAESRRLGISPYELAKRVKKMPSGKYGVEEEVGEGASSVSEYTRWSSAREGKDWLMPEEKLAEAYKKEYEAYPQESLEAKVALQKWAQAERMAH